MLTFDTSISQYPKEKYKNCGVYPDVAVRRNPRSVATQEILGRWAPTSHSDTCVSCWTNQVWAFLSSHCKNSSMFHRLDNEGFFFFWLRHVFDSAKCEIHQSQSRVNRCGETEHCTDDRNLCLAWDRILTVIFVHRHQRGSSRPRSFQTKSQRHETLSASSTVVAFAWNRSLRCAKAVTTRNPSYLFCFLPAYLCVTVSNRWFCFFESLHPSTTNRGVNHRVFLRNVKLNPSKHLKLKGYKQSKVGLILFDSVCEHNNFSVLRFHFVKLKTMKHRRKLFTWNRQSKAATASVGLNLYIHSFILHEILSSFSFQERIIIVRIKMQKARRDFHAW